MNHNIETLRNFLKKSSLRDDQRGATLTELVIVVFLLGIITIGMLQILSFTNTSGTVNQTRQSLRYNANRALDVMTERLDRVGLRITKADSCITTANTDEIVFQSDGNRERFYLSPTDSLAKTKNPNDRILFRSINGAVPGGKIATGVTTLAFDYSDSLGNSLLSGSSVPQSNRKNIRLIKLTVVVETGQKDLSYNLNNGYRQLSMSTTLRPPNMQVLR